MHDLEAMVTRAPAEALRAVQSRLEAPPGPADPLLQSQLLAVAAEANYDLSHPEAALESISRGLKILGAMDTTPPVSRVRLALQLLRAELMTVASDGAAAGAAVDKLLETVPANSIERACALSKRAIAYDFNDQSDQAVNSALGGYRLARANGWTNARIETAYTLAVNFRRAGLYDQAHRMIDEVISLERQEGRINDVSDAEYELGKLLIASNRPAEAREALERSRAIAERAGDRLGVATVNLPLCLAELDGHDLAAADVTCNTSDADLIAARRMDLDALLQSYRGRLDIEHGRPAAALAKLDAVLSGPIHRLLPGQESQIYRDRARARAALHRDREAVADLTRSHELDVAANLEQRNRQVAVMSAVIESDKLTAENRLLEERLANERQDLGRQRQARRFWSVLAIAALLLCLIFGYLLTMVRWRNRRLRRYEIILNRAGLRDPDAFMLLDENRRVCLANRPLCGPGPAPVPGQPLDSAVPPELLAELTQGIDRAFATRDFVSFNAELIAADGSKRQYELCVIPAVDGDDALGVTLRSTDITELRAVEREVLDLASLERQHLGGSLHEGLGQNLAGVLLMLGNLAAVINRGKAGAGALVAEIADHVARSIELARRMAQGLAPVTLARGSLGSALHALVEDAARRLQISVSSDCRLEEVLSEPAADHLYRICEDYLVLAATHGRAKHLSMTLCVSDDNLVLTLTDDGQSAFPAGGGLGIKMMTYRARSMGGTLTIHTPAPAGTCIAVSVPMAGIRPPADATLTRAARASRRSAGTFLELYGGRNGH